MRRLLPFVLLLTGCGAGEPVELAGVYYLAEIRCGESVVATGNGFQESIAFGVNGRATYRSGTAACVHKTEVDIIIDGSSIDFTARGTTCSESIASDVETGCALEYEIGGAPVTAACVNNPSLQGRIDIAGDGNVMTGSFDVNGTECTATYAR